MAQKTLQEFHKDFIRRNYKELSAVKMGKLLGFSDMTVGNFMRAEGLKVSKEENRAKLLTCDHSAMLRFAKKQGYQNVMQAIDAYGSRIIFRNEFLKTRKRLTVTN